MNHQDSRIAKNDPFPLPDIITVSNAAQYRDVLRLRGVYTSLFPGIPHPDQPDLHDFGARLWLTHDTQGHPNGTARLVLDGDLGLPSESHVAPYLQEQRAAGLRIGEFGRFIVTDPVRPTWLSRHYYGHLWAEALRSGVDLIVMVARQSKATLYGPCFGATQLGDHIEEDFGCGQPFSVFAWDISRTPSHFFDWSRPATSTHKEI